MTLSKNLGKDQPSIQLNKVNISSFEVEIGSVQVISSMQRLGPSKAHKIKINTFNKRGLKSPNPCKRSKQKTTNDFLMKGDFTFSIGNDFRGMECRRVYVPSMKVFG